MEPMVLDTQGMLVIMVVMAMAVVAAAVVVATEPELLPVEAERELEPEEPVAEPEAEDEPELALQRASAAGTTLLMATSEPQALMTQAVAAPWTAAMFLQTQGMSVVWHEVLDVMASLRQGMAHEGMSLTVWAVARVKRAAAIANFMLTVVVWNFCFGVFGWDLFGSRTV